MRRIALLLTLASGCATTPKTAVVDGREVPRLALQFDGQPYTVKHEGAHPKPGGPSDGLKDAGGSIRGRICGMEVDFDVAHKGDHVQLVGTIDGRMPATIDVSEHNGVRRFSGSLGILAVDFTLEPSQIQGHVGIRVFALEPQEDVYAGFMRIPDTLDIDGAKQRTGFVLRGREALWAMPAADQAAVLPAIMTCDGMQFQHGDQFDVGFGGQPTDRPAETSAVYTRGH
jgi:hypothetical protein